MAQSAGGSSWTIPTLEETYHLLMENSARTVQFLHQQMAQGHLLPDPWDEACTLRNAMSRTAHLFDCLWKSEPDPIRYENLREWVFIVHTDAKTRLKAIDLFVKLQQRKRQRSHISQQSHSKPCNPALHTPTTRETVTYDAPITDTIGKSTGQAMPDLRGTDVANAPHELVMACGMSPEFDEHVEQNHTVQLIGQYKWSTTNQDPNPELEPYPAKSYSYMDQFSIRPGPYVGGTIFETPHDSYPVQTFKSPGDAANRGVRRYSFPPPVYSQAPPHYNRTPLAIEYTSSSCKQARPIFT